MRKRVLAVAVPLAVAVLLGCGVSGYSSTGTSRAVSADAWVAPAGGADAPCTKTRPCASFDRAYHRAHPGGSVRIVGGTYPAQEISFDGHKSAGSAPVTFTPAGKQAVTIDGNLVLLGVRDVRFDRLKLKELAVLPSTRSTLSADTRYSSDVVFSRVGLKLFYINASSRITLRDSAIGNYSYLEGYGSSTLGTYDGMPPSSKILLDRVLFRGIRRDTSPSHAECLFLQNVDGVTIRRSRFVGCPVMGIFSQAVGSPLNPQHVLIENNFIGHPSADGSAAIYVDYRGGTPPANWVIRYNSLGGGLRFAEGSSFAGITVDANVGPNDNGYCGEGVSYSHNVWSTVRCAPSDRVAASGYRDPDASDFRLKPCSTAIGNGDPTSFPHTDITGHRRPVGNAPDAGAWEDPAPRCR